MGKIVERARERQRLARIRSTRPLRAWLTLANPAVAAWAQAVGAIVALALTYSLAATATSEADERDEYIVLSMGYRARSALIVAKTGCLTDAYSAEGQARIAEILKAIDAVRATRVSRELAAQLNLFEMTMVSARKQLVLLHGGTQTQRECVAAIEAEERDIRKWVK